MGEGEGTLYDLERVFVNCVFVVFIELHQVARVVHPNYELFQQPQLVHFPQKPAEAIWIGQHPQKEGGRARINGKFFTFRQFISNLANYGMLDANVALPCYFH